MSPVTPSASTTSRTHCSFPALATPDVFELKAEVATLAVEEGFLAVEVTALDTNGSIVLDVNGRLVVASPSQGGARFYNAAGLALEGWSTPKLAVDQPDTTALVLADGTQLPRLISGQSFWFAWYGNHPDTLYWPTG